MSAAKIIVLFNHLIDSAPEGSFPYPVALVVDEYTALAGRPAESRAQACATIEDDPHPSAAKVPGVHVQGQRGVVYIAPKLVTGRLDDVTVVIEGRALHDRQAGVLMHELAHVSLMFANKDDHSEREADEHAHALWGKTIRYDVEEVQTTGRGVTPRPKHLDYEANPRSRRGNKRGKC